MSGREKHEQRGPEASLMGRRDADVCVVQGACSVGSDGLGLNSDSAPRHLCGLNLVIGLNLSFIIC